MSQPENEEYAADGHHRKFGRRPFLAGALMVAGPLAAAGAIAPPAVAEPANGAGTVTTFPAPPQSVGSRYHSVWVNGHSSFVYQVNTLQRTAAAAKGPASYTTFDFTGTVTVRVAVPGTLNSAKVSPQRHGIKVSVRAGNAYFTISKPGQYTLEINGSPDHPLHVFANAPEADVPDPSDPNVIYYGPGFHPVGSLSVPTGKTLYLAGGAVLYATKSDADNPQWSNFFRRNTYDPVITVSSAANVTIRGRGIIDLSGLLWGEKSVIEIQNSTNVSVEGVILAQIVHEGVAAKNCDNVTIENVKVIGKEENTDAISLQGSRNSTVRNCFARSQDDVIYVNASSGPSYGNTVEDCVVWADRTHALGVVYSSGYEIHDVVFRNCDVLHSYGYDPTYDIALTVFTNDDKAVHDILFENVTVESAQFAFIQVEVTANSTSTISDVTFRNVRFTGPESVGSYVGGHDAESAVSNVLLDGVYCQGVRVTDPATGNFSINQYATVRTTSTGEPWKSPGIVAGQTYRIVNRKSGKAVQIAGANVEQWDYLGKDHQQWRLIDLGAGVLEVENVNTQWVLHAVNAVGAPTENGANIEQWMYGKDPSEQWRIISVDGEYVKLQNAASGKSAEVAEASTANGGNVRQWDYEGTSPQQWRFVAP